MPATVQHQLTATTPDDPLYEIRPSHWNSAHVVTLNAVGSEISGAFSNGGGVTFGLETNGKITASAPAAGGITGSISAGTTRGTLGEVVFSNSNGISFGINGQTLTAQHNGLTTAALSNHSHGVTAANGGFDFQTLSFSNANGISFGTSAGPAITASYTVPTVPAQFSGGNSNLGNTQGDTGVVTGRLVLVGTNNITLSGSTNGGSMTISISGGAGAAGNTGYVSAGTTNASLGTLSIANSNGISFGIDGQTLTATVKTDYLTSQSNQNVTAANGGFAFQTLSFSNANGFSFGTSAGSAITGSYTVPTQTNQTLGIYGTGNTTGESSSSTYDARSLTFRGTGIASVGWSNSSWIVSATQSDQALSGSNGSFAFQTATFGNSNGLSFYTTNGSMVGSYTVPTVTNSVWTVSDAGTSGTVARLAFTNLNGITLSLSSGAGGSHTIVGSHNALTSQSNQNVTADNGGFAFQTLSFSNANGFSFGTSAGSAITGSYTVPTVPAQFSGGNSNLGNTQGDTGVVTGRLVLVGTNNITLSGSTNGGSMTISISGGAGAAGNTGYVSAGTTNASLGTLSIADSNGISFGVNGQTLTATVKTDYLTSQSNQNVTAANGGFAFQTLSFSNANGFSFGTSAGSAITGSYTVPTQSVQPVALSGSNGSFNFSTATFGNSNGLSFYTTNGSMVGQQLVSIGVDGNTTGQSSQSTSYATNMWFAAAGIVSMGHTDGFLYVSATQSNQAFSAGGGSSAFQTLSFSNNAHGSWTNTNGQVALSPIQASAYAVSNTTQSSSRTVQLSALSFAGAGVASVGITNGSIVISVPSGGGGLTNINVSAGTTSQNLSNVVFSNSNNVSFGLNGSTITASASEVIMSRWYPEENIGYAGTAAANSSASITPFVLRNSVSASQIAFFGSIAVQTTTLTSSAGIAMGWSGVLYTRNGDTLSSFNSFSNSTSTFYQSNSTSSVAGGRIFTASLATASLFSMGEYWLAFHFTTATSGQTSLARTVSMAVIPTWNSGLGQVNYLGNNTTNTRGAALGRAIHSTGATRASIAFTDITGYAGNSAPTANLFFELRNYTVW